MAKNDFDEMMMDVEGVHRVWHKFSNYIVRTFGKDLHGEWQYLDIGGKKFKHRSFDDYKLSQRLVGYKTSVRIKKWIDRYAPEIQVVVCDDSVNATSHILLIPHPSHGITVIFIPQCTAIQNQFFLYKGPYNDLMKALINMKYVYKKG